MERIAHYEIVRLIGRGGMGEVYEAVDLDLARRVALKFIAPELAAEPEAFRRFEREARSAAALSHPHIATLFAFERAGDRPFLSMELMSGESLRDRLRSGALPVATALALARDVAAGLAHAHRRGIVHRDIKPENLMFDLEGAVKITDFGLAYAVQASRLTMTGTSLGTAAYMAPESLRGQAGAPADVFALGIVLHESIAGSLPFAGDTPLALMYTIANEPPVPLRALRPEVPEPVATLVARILTKDPAGRPEAAAVAREIAALTGAIPEPEEPPLAPAEGTATAPATSFAEDADTMPIMREPRTEEHEVERVPSRELVARERALERAGRPRRPMPAWWIPAVLVALAGGLWATRPLWTHDAGAARRKAIELTDRAVVLMSSPSPDTVRRAQPLLEAAIRADPRYPLAFVSLGTLRLGLGDPVGAMSAFRRVLAIADAPAGARARALYGLADVDMGRSNWPGAVGSLRAALAQDSTGPEAVQYYNNLGYALVQAGHPDSARDVLVGGLRRYPGNPNLAKNLGLAQFRLGRFQESLRALDEALIADSTLRSARDLRDQVRQAMARR